MINALVLTTFLGSFIYLTLIILIKEKKKQWTSDSTILAPIPSSSKLANASETVRSVAPLTSMPSLKT